MKTFLVVTALTASAFTCVLANSGKVGWTPGWGPSGGVTPKPGECPTSDPTVNCTAQRSCNSDCECVQKQKCCPQESCGFSVCHEPTVIIEYVGTCNNDITRIKPGTCPDPYPNQVCIQCYDQCKSDCECEGQDICCIQPGCGNTCRTPL